MSILGNIFLVILALLSVLTISQVFGKTPPNSGDAVGGYAMGLILFNVVMLACMLIITGVIAHKGGFQWLTLSPGSRNLVVWGGVLAMVATNAMSAVFKYEAGPTPALLKVFSAFVPALLPLIWIFTSAVLLNEGLRSIIPPITYQAALITGWVIGILGVISTIGGFISQSNSNAQARIAEMQADQARYHQDHLKQIDSTDANKSFINIIVFTDFNHDQDVRERALAKIKSNPNWQQDLIKYLDNENAALEAFTFLASNPVDDQQVMAEPVRRGTFNAAKKIRSRIAKGSHGAHFYADQFSYEIERILKTIDRFKNTGIDYKPALMELRAALDEPNPAKEVKFQIIPVLDKYIARY
ncbi:MAG: hypothetical protein JNJ57_11160 [Saprospiraceae bacterium]|nr:hypothetical protein [Saprospiraceae bacterium]